MFMRASGVGDHQAKNGDMETFSCSKISVGRMVDIFDSITLSPLLIATLRGWLCCLKQAPSSRLY